jgi:hypothetical protein
VYWGPPYKAIFHDLDGTLSGKGPNSFVAPYFKHLEQPECEVNIPVFHGVACNSDVQVRRVVFHEM